MDWRKAAGYPFPAYDQNEGGLQSEATDVKNSHKFYYKACQLNIADSIGILSHKRTEPLWIDNFGVCDDFVKFKTVRSGA